MTCDCSHTKCNCCILQLIGLISTVMFSKLSFIISTELRGDALIRIVICDDDASMCSQLNEYICRWSTQTQEPISVRCYHDADVMLSDFNDSTDILLLDICMQEVNGIEAAKKLRNKGKNVCIIFITGMAKYAVMCYKVRPFGFLTKPLCYEEFQMEFSDAANNIIEKRDSYIDVHFHSETRRVDIRNLIYLEAHNHTVTFYLNSDESLDINSSVNLLEQELNGKGFFRCHSAFLVNQRYIRSIGTTDLTLRNGIHIPISKHRRTEFLNMLTKYVGERI